MENMTAQFTNTKDAMTSFVFVSAHGGYGVSLRDDDSGEFLPITFHGYTLEAATAKAREIVNL